MKETRMDNDAKWFFMFMAVVMIVVGVVLVVGMITGSLDS
jgi:hypothetical protein